MIDAHLTVVVLSIITRETFPALHRLWLGAAARQQMAPERVPVREQGVSRRRFSRRRQVGIPLQSLGGKCFERSLFQHADADKSRSAISSTSISLRFTGKKT
jgi:hypothetical protein